MTKFFKISILYILIPLVFFFAAVFGTQEYLNHKDRTAAAEAEQTLQTQVEQLENELVISKEQLAAAQQEKVTSQERLENKQQEWKQKDETLNGVLSQIQEKETQISTLQSTNATLQERLDETLMQEDKEQLQQQIDANKAKIEELTGEIEDLKGQATALQNDVTQLNESIQSLTTQIEKINTMIESAELNVSLLTNQIEQIKNTISGLEFNGISKVVIQTNGVSYILFQNSLCIQWGKNNCDSNGVITQNLSQTYTNTDYLILLTPFQELTTATVWGTRVDNTSIKNNSFKGYYTFISTKNGMGYSNGGGYYWMTIGLAA